MPNHAAQQPSQPSPQHLELQDPHALSAEVLQQQLSTTAHGISDAEAGKRRELYGANTMPETEPTPAWIRFLQQFQNVLIYILLASGAVSLALGHTVDSAVIFGVVLINCIVGYIQEGKAESALRAILSMTKTLCMVVRDGTLLSIDSEQLVPGDIVTLQAGDKIPADLRIFYCKDLRCDESALTGESQPVGKTDATLAADTPLAERKNMAYMGTLVTYGVARGIICYTGTRTEIGAIGDLVRHTRLPKTPLQLQLKRFAQQLSIGIGVVALVAMLIGIFLQNYSFSEMFQAAIGIAVAAIPEGLPAIVTITLAIGVQRMAQNRALVRRLPSVEVLGSVDVICSDKTGTLTTNAMTARQLYCRSGLFDISGEGYRPEGAITRSGGREHVDLEQDEIINRTCLIASLCNDANLINDNGEWQLHGDPTEGALLVLARKHGLNRVSGQHHWPRIDELPFETERRYMATLHHDPDGQKLLAIKGAPERIIAYSTRQLGATGEETCDAAGWQQAQDKMAAAGMRVMALAQKTVTQNLPVLNHQQAEAELTLVGLVGISDPPKAEAIASVRECHQAGIRVKMITGDSPITALAIGRELGLQAERVLTGAELDKLNAQQLQQAAEDVDIFARTSPANKLQLVNALQQRQHVVSMTGDGVNDAPALRQADIGVAMGKKGTDAAKEAADIVLTDDNFSTIAKAVAEGRTVYDNIVKSILFILPTNLAEALIIIVAIITGRMLPITPAQILWVNMVTAVTLALALAFEGSEPGTMTRKPRPRHQGLITKALLTRMLLVGGYAALVIFWQFSGYRSEGASLELSRAIAVNTLVVIEAVYLINCRLLNASIFCSAMLKGFKPALLAICCVIVIQLLFTYLPQSQRVFGLASLSWNHWLAIVASCLPLLLVVEVEKWLWRKIVPDKILAMTTAR